MPKLAVGTTVLISSLLAVACGGVVEQFGNPARDGPFDHQMAPMEAANARAERRVRTSAFQRVSSCSRFQKISFISSSGRPEPLALHDATPAKRQLLVARCLEPRQALQHVSAISRSRVRSVKSATA
jgi:hypothetical protein